MWDFSTNTTKWKTFYYENKTVSFIRNCGPAEPNHSANRYEIIRLNEVHAVLSLTYIILWSVKRKLNKFVLGFHESSSSNGATMLAVITGSTQAITKEAH